MIGRALLALAAAAALGGCFTTWATTQAVAGRPPFDENSREEAVPLPGVDETLRVTLHPDGKPPPAPATGTAAAPAGSGAPAPAPESDRVAVLRTGVLSTVPSFGSTLTTQVGPVSRLPTTRPSLPETLGTDDPIPQLFGTIIIIITRP